MIANTFVKDMLVRYVDIGRELENEFERLEHIESKMYSVSSNQYEYTGKQEYSEDRISIYIHRKEKQKEKIEKIICLQKELQNSIESMVEKLNKPDERAVIEMRYIDGEAWMNVSEMLFGAKEDYEDKKESYLRRTTKLHEKALLHLAEIFQP